MIKMNKSKKIIIGILVALIICVCIVISICFYQKSNTNKVSINIDNEYIGSRAEQIGKAVKINGKVYYDTGKISKELRCGVMDGKITSNVEDTEIPSEDNQSNFKGEYDYQYSADNKVEVFLDNEWHIFETNQSEFIISVYDKSMQTDNKIKKILDKSEMDGYDCDIYAYDVNVNITIDGEDMTLRDALLQNKITMEEIIKKAKEDIPNPIIYKDGGSIEYKYDSYTIIKLNTLEGNRDVYIGMPGMNINDII